MDIGTGIAIAGVWLFAAIVVSSKQVTSIGSYISIACAISITIFLGS